MAISSGDIDISQNQVFVIPLQCGGATAQYLTLKYHCVFSSKSSVGADVVSTFFYYNMYKDENQLTY